MPAHFISYIYIHIIIFSRNLSGGNDSFLNSDEMPRLIFQSRQTQFYWYLLQICALHEKYIHTMWLWGNNPVKNHGETKPACPYPRKGTSLTCRSLHSSSYLPPGPSFILDIFIEKKDQCLGEALPSPFFDKSSSLSVYFFFYKVLLQKSLLIFEDLIPS